MLTAVIPLWCSGCAGPSLRATNPASLSADQYRPVLDASVQVLRRSGFSVDRMDFRFGRITSKPKGSPTLFEPWITDNTYLDQATQSTLGDLRRTVTVAIDRADSAATDKSEAEASGGALSVRVEVLLERFQVPVRRMNGRTQGSVFADLREVPQELSSRGIASAYWRPVGRDVHLEQRLLESILEQSGLLPG